MADDKNSSIDNITAQDFANINKAIFLSGISQINFALYTYKMNSYSKVISEMNDCYKHINSINFKKSISSLIDDANIKYINRKKENRDMSLDEFVTFCINGVGVSKNIYKGVTETKYRCDFSIDLNTAIDAKEIVKNESKILNKIFEYHIFAKYAKEKYGDQKTYSSVQKECVDSYKIIDSEKGKELLLKYISKEFLKVKSKKK